MPIRMLSQRAGLVDQSGRMEQPWFVMFGDMVRWINRQSSSSATARKAITGTTDSTLAVSMPIDMGNTGNAVLTLAMTATNNANAKTVTVKVGDTVVQTIAIDASTSSQTAQVMICGRGKADQYTALISGTNCTGTGMATAVDMSSGSTLSVYMQLGTTTDTIALESWALETRQS